MMGIELGAPKERIERCPAGNAALTSAVTCLEESSMTWGLPITFHLAGWTSLVDGRVAAVYMTVRRDSDFQRLKSIMVERYGPPHRVSTEEVTTRSGAVVPSEESAWNGSKVNITLSERAGRVDQSRVSFSYKPLAQAAQERSRQALALGLFFSFSSHVMTPSTGTLTGSAPCQARLS